MKFVYDMSVNLVFGRGRIDEIGERTAAYGKKALLVVGKGSARRTGLLDRVIARLAAAGVGAVVFDEVEQNPLTTTAERGAKRLAAEGCDVVVGVGGGSVMDAAKAMAFIAENEGDVSDYIFGRKIGGAALPVVVAPTTAGTGSEGNCFAVLTNPATMDKKSLRTPLIFPKVSIVDPELPATMSKAGLATSGFDALTHCIEAYISRAAQPMTDLMALEGIALLAGSLPAVYEGTADEAARDRVSWAATIGGMVICSAGVGAPHGMEHPASGLHFDLVHAHGLAALLPPVLRRSKDAAREKLDRVSVLLGGKDADDCANALEAFLDRIGLRLKLSDLGVREEDIDWMTVNCLKVSAPSIKNSPVPLTAADIAELYREAL